MPNTPEQDAIASLETASNLVVANAGTGKTYTLKELWIRRFEAEYKRFCRGRELSNEELRRLCKQFITTTFTVKAAAELNERLYQMFAERDIPIPMAFGKPVRLCRTLDSYLQSWIAHPVFFSRWLQDDRRLNERIEGLAQRLPGTTRAAWGQAHDKLEYAIFRRWPWSIPNEMAEFILELIVRELKDAPLEGFSLADWVNEFDILVHHCDPDAREQVAAFWRPKIEAKRAYFRHLREVSRKLDFGEFQSRDDHIRAMEYTRSARNLQGIVREFITVFGLARVRNFDPVFHPEAMGSQYMLKQLAQAKSLETLEMFLAIARRYWDIKARLFARDFTDNLIDFTHTVSSHADLLERNREYPRWIRGKYVFWDECQDNNGFQFEVLNLMTPKTGVPYLTVAVGDPKQAIYAWRGAAPKRFCRAIEKTLEQTPQCVHTLTLSFRSAIRIVALGNEIVSTLPSYAKSVFPSKAVLKDEGEIVVSGVLFGEDDESAWVLSQVDRIQMRNPSESIMVIARGDPSAHPVVNALNEHHPDAQVRFMTIHKSKGLEADNVFVLGLTAGRFPDMRSDDNDSEVNLFYVACTRPRLRLFLAAPTLIETVDDKGQRQEKSAGPSPYLWKVPTLRRLALKAGWPKKVLEESERVQNGVAAGMWRQAEARFETLQEEALKAFGEEGVEVLEDNRTIFDHGDSSLYGRVDNGEPRALQSNSKPLYAVADWQDLPDAQRRFRQKVYGKLRLQFLRDLDGLVNPRALTPNEVRFCAASGWILRKKEYKGRWAFSNAFRELFSSHEQIQGGR